MVRESFSRMLEDQVFMKKQVGKEKLAYVGKSIMYQKRVIYVMKRQIEMREGKEMMRLWTVKK